MKSVVIFSAGSFVAGVFEKAGIEPQVKRLGKYKSAGDQLARKDMSEPQREQLSALLDDIYSTFKDSVASSVKKTSEEVSLIGLELLQSCMSDISKLL